MSDILGLFYYQFPTDCHDLYIFGKGGVLPNIQSKFHQNRTKLRDLWDHLLPKLFKKIRVREALSDILGLFYYQFPTDCHDLYIFGKGGVLPNIQSKFHQNRTKTERLMGPFIAKIFKKFESERLLSDILGLFYYQFPTDCHDLYIFGKGGVLPNIQSKFHQNRTKTERLMGPFIAKTIQKNSSPRGFCLIFLDCFTINFQPIAMICTFLERGESYLTYNQSFIKNRTKTERLMGPFIAKNYSKKFESERLLSDILDCFTINFQPIAMICTFWKGGSLT